MLIIRGINFKVTLPIRPQITNVTDVQIEEEKTYNSNNVLCTTRIVVKRLSRAIFAFNY